MRELTVKRRSRLRSKDMKKVLAWMEEEWGIGIPEDMEMETCSVDGQQSYVVNGKIVGMEEKGGFMMTLKGIMELKPTKRWVTVDMGAVRFLANGADVMAPGIVEADPGIEEGDIVWIRDERNLRPLCVGRALIPGSEMGPKDSGKAVKTLHYVGDPIWNVVL
jgi:PUA domain protein